MKDSDNLIGSISGWFSYFFLSMRLEHSMEVNISFLDYIQRNGTRSTFDTPLWIGNWTKHHLEVGCRLPTQTIVLHPDLRPLFNDCPIIELQLLRLEVCVRYNAGMIALAPCSPMPGYSYHFKDGQTKWHGGGTAHFTVRLMQIYMSGYFVHTLQFIAYDLSGLFCRVPFQIPNLWVLLGDRVSKAQSSGIERSIEAPTDPYTWLYCLIQYKSVYGWWVLCAYVSSICRSTASWMLSLSSQWKLFIVDN